jgi:hypothetical protein
MAEYAINSVSAGKYARQIIVSAPGPQGPMGRDGLQPENLAALVSYRHLQGTPLVTWTVVHNLNFFPNVTVFDSGESQVEGSVTHIDENSLTITFSSAIAGKAHLS